MKKVFFVSTACLGLTTLLYCLWPTLESWLLPTMEIVLSLIFWTTVCVILGITAVFTLAKADIFFTFVKEGSAKVILNMGAFHKVVMQYKGLTICKKTNNVVSETKSSLVHRIFGGLRWIGIPFINTIHRYTFRWITIRPQTGEVIKREEKLDFILVRDDIYAVEVKGAESEGMVPLDIVLLLTMRSENPYKSLFKAQDWSEMIFNRSEATFREYVSSQSFEKLVKEKQAAGGELYSKLESQGLLDKFLSDYGIRIKAVEMKEIRPSGAHAKVFEEAAAKKWQAEKEQNKIEALADAEVNRIDKVYKKIREFGELGTAIRFMESLDKAGEKSGNWIIPFGDIKTAIQGLLGNKIPK